MTTPPQPAYPYPGGWTPPPQPVRLVPIAPNGAPLADFWYRLGAYMLDSLIIGAISMVVAVPALIVWFVYFFSQFEVDSRGQLIEPANPFEAIWLLLLIEAALIFFILIVSYFYFVEYQLRKGQTVGKRVLKIKITPVDPRAALTRADFAKRWAVGHVVGSLVPFFSYVDGLWQLWDKPLQQCLHDKAAKTVVIRVG